MSQGWPSICISTIAEPCRAARVKISGSSRPADTSLIIFAPASMAKSATSARVVSILTIAAGRSCSPDWFASLQTAGRTSRSLSICAPAETRELPGLVLSAPMSIISAPSSMSLLARAKASRGLRKFPPSEKLSGVIFSIPMTTGLAEARAFKMSASRASIAEMIIPELRRKIQPEVCGEML